MTPVLQPNEGRVDTGASGLFLVGEVGEGVSFLRSSGALDDSLLKQNGLDKARFPGTR
jgi:hypothetical protein